MSEIYCSCCAHSETDAAFIAHARTDVPRLVAALKLAREQIRNEATWIQSGNPEDRFKKYDAEIEAILRGEK